MAFNFAPRGWALCNGQILQVSQNQALASLLGKTYGGDGRTTFALPNLQGPDRDPQWQRLPGNPEVSRMTQDPRSRGLPDHDYHARNITGHANPAAPSAQHPAAPAPHPKSPDSNSVPANFEEPSCSARTR